MNLVTCDNEGRNVTLNLKKFSCFSVYLEDQMAKTEALVRQYFLLSYSSTCQAIPI